jgi:hypothetical protein
MTDLESQSFFVHFFIHGLLFYILVFMIASQLLDQDLSTSSRQAPQKTCRPAGGNQDPMRNLLRNARFFLTKVYQGLYTL